MDIKGFVHCQKARLDELWRERCRLAPGTREHLMEGMQW